jgi:hypothetical protein
MKAAVNIRKVGARKRKVKISNWWKSVLRRPGSSWNKAQ